MSEIETKVAVSIHQNDVVVQKGYANSSDLDRMLKLPLPKKIRAVRILRKSNIEESERRKRWEMEWKKTQRECKELSDDEFYGMLK
jgi:ribosomal protein S10